MATQTHVSAENANRGAADRGTTVPTGPLPIVFGVTGHRDLREEDIAALEERVRSIFEEFQRRYPHTPLVLLSPLAEGADRLVARVALRCGVRLVVPLPMCREEYVRDFTTPQSREELEELIRQAGRWFELPLLTQNTPQNIHDQNTHRAEQYALVGAYIVRHCQALIALWNGVRNADTGGTSQVIEFQQEGIPDRYREALYDTKTLQRNYLEPMENGPIFHIVTPRRSHPDLEGEPLSLRRYYPNEDPEDAESPATFDRICRNIDAFNENAARINADPALRALKDRNAGYLLPDAQMQTLPPSLSALREYYAIADTLASRFQGWTLQSLRRLSALAFLAVLLFEVGAKLTPDNGWMALSFPGLLAATYLFWHFTMRRGKWQDRHQDYRALAEGLRVEFFWRLAGIRASVADHYLRKQRGELDWIRIAIRNLSGAALEPVEATEHNRRFELVREHWVNNQARYFARAAHRDDHKLEHFEAWIKRLMLFSQIVAVLTALAMILPTPLAEWMHHHVLAHKLLIILVFVLLGIAGLLHNYVDKLALSQHVKQYDRMGTLFGLAEHRLAKCAEAGQAEEAQQIILELGREALAENGDWVMTHRERPVDVPHAG